MILIDTNVIMYAAGAPHPPDARIMARDALHAAVVTQEGLEAVCSYDSRRSW
jgi:predicted nucleic acid-binding protein